MATVKCTLAQGVQVSFSVHEMCFLFSGISGGRIDYYENRRGEAAQTCFRGGQLCACVGTKKYHPRALKSVSVASCAKRGQILDTGICRTSSWDEQ